jgi:predicted ATPase
MKEQVFVGRERELGELKVYLDRALAGQGQLCFVTGQAGSGKTALVQQFARQALAADPDLVLAMGTCNAQAGIGDPYLPFREALATLTGDAAAQQSASRIAPENTSRLGAVLVRSVQVLVEVAPELIGAFVPGANLLGHLGKAVVEKAGWMDQLDGLAKRKGGAGEPATEQRRIFEQYTAFLQNLSTKTPLILFLDDLHWADGASLGLLFQLGRHLEASRILILGTFRPNDVALGRDGERHPLELVVNELTRYHGDVSLDLDSISEAVSRQFVDSLLDAEPNDLGEAFRQALFQQTGGNALFTVELIQAMKERGDLVRAGNGRWREGPSLDWNALPARVEGVIAERIARLGEALKQLLVAGSVEGEQFTAEVIARVQTMSEREAIRALSDHLQKQHRLVSALGLAQLGGVRLSHYRFRHVLFQRYVYHSLDEAERAYLHEAVGNELERLYGAQTEEIAVELARHFEQAGLTAKAVGYLQQAGHRAVRLSANQEALAHFYRGLALLETLPETAERARQELALQIALFAPLAGAKGYGAPELGKAYARAQELSEQVGEPGQVFLVLYGLWGHNFVKGDMRTARELSTQCLALAEKTQARALLMEAHRMMDETSFYSGELIAARQHLERTISLYDPQLHRAHATVYGQDPGVASRSHGASILWHLGYPDQARRMGQEALALGEASSHPFSLAFALCLIAMLHQSCGDGRRVEELAEAAIRLSTEQGFVIWLALATALLGWALANRGQSRAGIAHMRQGLADNKAININLHETYFLALLAEAYGQVGQPAPGLALLAEALALMDKSGLRHYEAELYRLKGELLRMQGEEPAAVEANFRRALDIARRQAVKSLELRAATSLGRLLQRQGKPDEARQVLAETYGWFTEGFDTADLKEAKALLEELS